MRAVHHLLGTSALALVGLAAPASEFDPLISAASATWPGKNHIGVVCHYANNKEQIESLREAAGAGSTITVVNAKSELQSASAKAILLNRKADYLVLLPNGGVFCEGSFLGTKLVRSMASSGVPSVGTTSRSIRQGAAFAVGEETGWTLLVNEHLVGTITVELPQKGQVFKGGGGAGLATLDVVSLAE
jgi:hypothetical protein